MTQTNDHVQRELYNDASVYFYLLKFQGCSQGQQWQDQDKTKTVALKTKTKTLALKTKTKTKTVALKTKTKTKTTRSPAIAEGPRDAGVPVEIW